MSDTNMPLIIEPSAVKSLIGQDKIVIIDLCQPDTYIQQHVPTAVFLDYSWIVRIDKPRMGLLPDPDQLARILTAYGIDDNTHVITYDDEGGGRACRFLWTLQCIGHNKISLINGGLHAWVGEGHGTESEIHFPSPLSETRTVSYIDASVADKHFILDHLNDKNTVILDTRSPMEYTGSKVFAARGGHIPGAVNYDWMNAMDKSNNLKLKGSEQLKSDLEALGITPDKTIVCHCQSHHRSAHTCIMLNSIGFEKVKGYPGSWSDWGNDPGTPIE